MVVGRCRRDGIPMVCVETLYQEYYRRQELVRRGLSKEVLPKGSAFDAILDEEMRRIDRMLNDRPLKCLDWRTPREAFTALLHRHLLAAA